jgi:enterochelin esterase family protein
VQIMVAVALVSALLPAPRVERAAYPSKVFGGSRAVRVYTPPADIAGKPAGLLICLWGADYVDKMAAPETLEALIRGHQAPPLTVVFLDDPDDRFQDFQTTQKIARSIVEELVPWARTSLGVTADAAHTIVAGYSAAGLASVYTVFAHPDAVGNVLAQSGAFWRGFDGGDASSSEWLAAQFAAAPTRTTRFSLEVGGAETRPAGGSGVSILVANQHLRDVLVKKGYAVSYREVPGAQHEYGHWQAAFGPALIALTRDWR